MRKLGKLMCRVLTNVLGRKSVGIGFSVCVNKRGAAASIYKHSEYEWANLRSSAILL